MEDAAEGGWGWVDDGEGGLVFAREEGLYANETRHDYDYQIDGSYGHQSPVGSRGRLAQLGFAVRPYFNPR